MSSENYFWRRVTRVSPIAPSDLLELHPSSGSRRSGQEMEMGKRCVMLHKEEDSIHPKYHAISDVQVELFTNSADQQNVKIIILYECQHLFFPLMHHTYDTIVYMSHKCMKK